MMTKYLIGRKRGMTQVFAEDGECVPVTVIEAGPCVVTQVRTPEKDGYSAVQLGFESAKEKHLRKPQAAFFKKINVEPMRHLRECRLTDGDTAPEVGEKVKARWRETKGDEDSDALAGLMGLANDPWMRFFLAHDPSVDLAKVRCPVLALFGGTDIQVDDEQNLPAVQAALAEGENPDVTVLAQPGLLLSAFG